MDLGKLKFRCQGGNALKQAVHNSNGLAWTDGTGIYLSPVSLFQCQIEQQEHYKLGEFDRGVWSVHWSDNLSKDLCYLCVVHDKNISLWRVDGHQPKLSFKQVRKINIQPIPQGCLWGPDRDILCVLCAHQSSIYYSHQRNKGSQVLLQLERDKIRCGCWVTDSSKLIICVSTTLMVYHWSDIDKSVIQYTVVHWTVPGLIGRISSIVPVSNSRVVVAAELPLESLCKQQDTFVLPDLVNSNTSQPDRQQDGTHIIRPSSNTGSITSTLFNLPRNPHAVVEDFCKIDCVELQEGSEPCVVSSCQVKGILTPDILLYQGDQAVVVVSSNTQSLLQVYHIDEDTIYKTSDILLNKDERAKGIGCFQSVTGGDGHKGILVLVGKTASSDAAFLPATNTVTMKSVLKFFTVNQGSFKKPQLAHTASASSIPVTMTTNGNTRDDQYDKVTQHIMNFDLNLQSTRSLGKLNGETNGDSALSISEKNHVSKKETLAPEPPKRPVRKKKSLRGKQDLSQTSSNSSDSQKDYFEKMPMECMSDSSECSPRDFIVRKPDVQSSVIISQSFHSEKELIRKVTPDSLISKSVVTKVDINQNCPETFPTTSDNPHVNTEISTQTLKFPAQETLSDAVKIVEIDGNCTTNGELKIETVDFESQKRDFNNENCNVLCREDVENSEQMENVINKNVETKLETTQQFAEVEASQSFSEQGKKLGIDSETTHEEETNLPCTEYSEKLGTMPVESVNEYTETSSTSEWLNTKLVDSTYSESLESLDDIDRILQAQNKKIMQLQEQMNTLSRRVDESSCVLPTRYQSLVQPDVVHLCFLCKDGFEIKKKFLLDNGRLKLDQVKQAFCLSTLELLIDGDWCVTGSNIDGYIPVRFDASSIVYINGNP